MIRSRSARHLSRGTLCRGLCAAVAATAVALGTGPAALAATTVSQQPTPTARAHPAAAQAGARLPFATEQAEDAATTGKVVGPDYTQGTVASEASGRKAVQLSAGQTVEFTLKAAANAMTLAYSVPDGQDGTLDVSAAGQEVEGGLPVTSKYSYVDTSWIAGSKTHHFFSHSRVRFGHDAKAGDKVTLKAASDITVDSAGFEQVGPAAKAPQGAVDVTDHGADPTGEQDSTAAFKEAVAAAKGGTVWIPEGDFTLGSELSGVSDVTLQGAGNWYSRVHSSRFINQPASDGKVHIKDFAVLGDVTERVDSSPDNFVNGSLGAGSSVSGMWVQHMKVGLWLTGTNDGLTVTDSRFLDLTADGINLNGTAKNVTVSNNYVANTGDDGLAMWALNATNSDDTFKNNTVVQPNLANGIALYGGENLTVTGNLVQDTNALGSGIAVSNQAFAAPFFPLGGTITLDGNELVRTGAMNPNWKHPMGALRVDSYDSAIAADVKISGTTVTDSPWSAFEFVSGGGQGYDTKNITVDGATVSGTGTVVVQAEAKGGAAISNVKAAKTGVAGVYNCPYPEGGGTFTLTDGGGNGDWVSDVWKDCTAWPGQAGS